MISIDGSGCDFTEKASKRWGSTPYELCMKTAGELQVVHEILTIASFFLDDMQGQRQNSVSVS